MTMSISTSMSKTMNISMNMNRTASSILRRRVRRGRTLQMMMMAANATRATTPVGGDTAASYSSSAPSSTSSCASSSTFGSTIPPRTRTMTLSLSLLSAETARHKTSSFSQSVQPVRTFNSCCLPLHHPNSTQQPQPQRNNFSSVSTATTATATAGGGGGGHVNGTNGTNNNTDYIGNHDYDHDLDELCQKHMDLPAQEFAMGCSFLHQVAIGVPVGELNKMVQDMPTLINFRDYDRRTPLHIAASEGHLDICQYLVENGAKINRSDRWGGSAMDDAGRHRHTHVMDYLRSCGAVFGSPSQASNFITAAAEGDIEEVRTLLEYGGGSDGGKSLVNTADYDRRTALHLASGEGHLDVVRLLIEHGADPNVTDRFGNRPLDDCKASQHDDVIQFLEDNGAIVGTTLGCSKMGQEALLDLMETYGTIRPHDDADKRLSLDWCGVSNLLKSVGQDPTDQVVQKLFEVADVDHDGWIDTDEFITHSEMFLGGRPARIILVVGGPGSGKGVLCERLVRECGVVHVSSGELLRAEVQQGTDLGKQVEEIMKTGGLVSSAIMVTLMQKHMRDHPGKRILLDGFPRSLENARDLVTLCGKPELALHLECDDTVMLERILKRGSSGDRADDNIETAIRRIRTYHKSHDMTLQFLREEHVPIVNLDCSATAEGVWSQLRSIGRLMRAAVKLPTASSRGSSSNSSHNKKNNSSNTATTTREPSSSLDLPL